MTRSPVDFSTMNADSLTLSMSICTEKPPACHGADHGGANQGDLRGRSSRPDRPLESVDRCAPAAKKWGSLPTQDRHRMVNPAVIMARVYLNAHPWVFIVVVSSLKSRLGSNVSVGCRSIQLIFWGIGGGLRPNDKIRLVLSGDRD